MISRAVEVGLFVALFACVISKVNAESSSAMMASEVFEVAAPKVQKPCPHVVIEELPPQKALRAKVAMINPEFRCYLPRTFGALHSISKQEFHNPLPFVKYP